MAPPEHKKKRPVGFAANREGGLDMNGMPVGKNRRLFPFVPLLLREMAGKLLVLVFVTAVILFFQNEVFAAVAHDAASESHTGTTGSTNQASFSWTHTPVGTPRGVLVFVFTYSTATKTVTGVTYGGVAMTAIAGGAAADTAGEPGRVDTYFLGASIPTGARPIVVTRTNNGVTMYAAAATQTAGGDTEVTGMVLLQENGTFAVQSVDDGSPGTNSLRYAGAYAGGSNNLAAGTGSTILNNIDIGARTFNMARETTAGQGPRNVGFSYNISDDRAAVHLAVREIPATTLASGADPAAATIAPGAAATDVDAFTFQTSFGTEAITSVTVNLSTSSGVGRLAITDNAGAELGFTTSPVSGSNTIAVAGMSATTALAAFKVRVTPLSHAAMPVPPGAAYAITAPVTAWAGLNTHTGSDTNPNALTIDNFSPSGATAASGSAGDARVTLNWTTSVSADFSRSVVLRWTGAAAGAEVPAEGTDYANGTAIGTATVVCVRTTDAVSTAVSGVDGAGTGGCSATALSVSQAYTYKVFQKDANGNYDTGMAIGTFTTLPRVVSINCSGACTASNFSTVSWTVTFSTSVTGVDASAFALVAGGLTGASITGVSGSGTTWTVSAYSGAGTGTLGLNQTGPGSVSPTLSGTFTGQVYAIGAPPLLAEYRMDEAFWNGTANEVADVSGNGNNAQAYNGASPIGTTPAISGNPGTCNYGVFDNGGTITQGYVQTPLPNLTADFTVTAWIRTTNNTIGGQRILIDDQNNTGGYGISLGDGAAGILRFFSRGITPVILDSTYTIANNTWYFIAAVADMINKKRTIYVFNAAGTLLNATTEAAWTAGAWGTDAGPVSIGGETNTSGEAPATYHLRGNLDEVRVYQQALSQAAVTAIATQTHACAITTSVNHFTIDIGGATASTCTPKNITITVLDASNNVLTGYTGTINITTSPAHGDWATVTAAGTLTPGAADSGAASYQFVAADSGAVTLALSNDHADTALTVSVVDSLAPASSTTSAAISFSDNTFVLTNDPVQVAGRPQAMSVAMWRKNPGAGAICSVSNRYTGARNLKAWHTRDTDDPGGTAPSIAGMTSPPLGTSVPGSNNLTLTFAAGTANFNLSTVDVGKYVINLRDDSGAFGGGVINGSSNTITTRPFALVVSAIKQGAANNPANTGPAGAVFAKAGTNFQATVGAYRWNSAADSNVALGDGVPDAAATLAQITANGATPSYTWPTTVSGGAPYTPAAGTPSPWSNIQVGLCPANAPNCFASGIATPTNLSYAEVGSFTLSVASTGFLNTPGVDLTAANGTALVFDNTPARNGAVGRFTPDHFNTAVISLSGLPMACPTGLTCPLAYNGFVYSGEPFSAQITAQNAANATTRNYDGALGFSKTVTLSAWNAVGGATQNPGGGTFSSAGAAPAAFSSGATPAIALGAITQNYSLPNVTAPTNIYIRAVDADAVTSLLAVPANSVEGGVSVANARLRLFNNFGNEKTSLPLSLQAQYWSGKSWVLSSTDSSTAIPASSVALSNYRDGTGATTAAWTTSASGPGTLASGQGTLTLSAPTPAGNTGCVDVAINLGTATQDASCLANHPVMTAPASSLAWLRGQYGSCAASTIYAADPSASACFGIYAPETRKTIHVRELF